MTKKRVLVVEDEKEIATILEDILQLNDADAIIATEGSSALEVLKNSPVSFVISDITLPDTNGIDLYKSIKKIYPDLGNRFIFMSGYNLDEETESFVEQTGNRYIQKPFHITELLRIIEKYL